MNKKEVVIYILFFILLLGLWLCWIYQNDKALAQYEERCNKIGWTICEAEAGLKTK